MVAGGGVMTDVYSLNSLPWHKRAFVSMKEESAMEAGTHIQMVYFEKRPATVFLNGVNQETKDFAVVRSAIPDYPEEAILGYVKKNYHILQPLEICEAFDNGVRAPVETLGFLGNGEKLFLTWKLPGFDVNGDEVMLYGFVAAGYDGKFGASLYVVSVRVICLNTFSMAVSEGESNKNSRTETKGKIWSGRHNSNNLQRDLEIWMEHVQDKAILKSNDLSAMFGRMAEKPMNNQALTSILGRVYPDPKPLPADFPEALRAEKQFKIDLVAEKAKRDRDAVSALFGGAGIAITPDGWGLFNSITEYENHVRMTKKPAEYSLLLGNRAVTMNRAANVIYDWAVKK